MARNHLRFSVDAWRDDDWLDLSESAQWLFTTMLSQPKMTLVGSLDVNVMRWAGLNRTATVESVMAALDELRERRFVVVDESTGELIVRSFTKNDLSPTRVSQQIAKGFWSAWKGVLSTELRRQVVDNCPDDIWEKVEPYAPDDALQMRRSAPIDREPPPPIDRELQCQSIIQNPEASSLKPETSSQQPNGAAAAEREELFSQTVDVLVDWTMRQRPPKTNRGGYEAALRRGKWEDHYERAMPLLDTCDITPHDFALVLEPDLCPDRTPLRLVNRERCRTCNDTTWLNADMNDDGTWGAPKPCPDCNESRTA